MLKFIEACESSFVTLSDSISEQGKNTSDIDDSDDDYEEEARELEESIRKAKAIYILLELKLEKKEKL